MRRFQTHWQVATAAVLPLEARNQVIGALLVFDRDQQHQVGSHTLQLLQIFASQAAVTIDNMQLLQESQHRQAELEALTAYNNLLIEASPVGKAVLDLEGRFVRANPAFQVAIAPEIDQIEGKHLAQLFPQVERTTLAQMVHSALERGVSQRTKAFYYPYLERGGRWFDLSLNPLRDSNDAIIGVMMTLVDITPLKQLEADLRHHNERIERQLAQHRALYEMGTQINAELDVQRVLEALMISIRSSFSVDGMAMMMPTDPYGFEFVSAFGLSANYLAREQVLYASSANGRAIEQLAPILIADIEQDERMGPLREAARREGLHTALYLPFIYRDEVVGLMSLYHRQAHRYTLEEMELLAIFANQATTAIKNAQFYTSVVQSRSNMNAILHSMTDGVIALDEQGCVTFINQPLFDLLNIPPATEWVGRSSEELWPQLRELLHTTSSEDPLTPTQGAGVRRMEIELLTPPRTLELIHSPILDGQGQRIGRLLLLHDITEIRASERMKDELISIISHELRTPLTTILGYSKLLLDRPDGSLAKRNRWITHILDKSRLLNRLVNEMLDLSRLNMQRFEIKLAPTDLLDLLRRMATEHRVMTDKHMIHVEVEGDVSAVSLDADRIEQLLSNLLINAIKYSPDGGLILIRAVRDETELRLSVTDQGLGIARENHHRVFEPFYRVDQSTTRDVYGTGLGLPLCQGIAEAHGGYIALDSMLGEGSTFTVHLPV
ncbi:MAG: PAS domain-containing protein [Ardenticatenales bacterium]|nr:PAS domain-containing protein [Ardenticatenales bacterium]